MPNRQNQFPNLAMQQQEKSIWSLKKGNRSKQLLKHHHKFLNSRHLMSKAQQNHRNLNSSNSFLKTSSVFFSSHQKQSFDESESEQKIENQIDKQIEQLSSCHTIKQKQAQLREARKLEETDYEQNQKLKGNNFWLWKNYLFQAANIRKNIEKELAKNTVLSEQERQKKITKQTMAHMEFMLEDIAHKIEEKEESLKDIKRDIKYYYEQNHKVYQSYMEVKKKMTIIEREEHDFQQELKAQEKQRKSMLAQKRTSKAQKNQFEYLDLNLNDKGIKQIIEKRARLNMELDLSYQVQQRKKINQAKAQFAEKKKAVETQLKDIEKKIEKMKKIISTKEKEEDKLLEEKEKHDAERQDFLKELLKEPRHRLDGIFWALKKMVEYGYPKPKPIDMPGELDQQSKNVVIRQFESLKKEFLQKGSLFQQKPRKSKRKGQNKKRECDEPVNRARVRSMTNIQNASSFQSFRKSEFSINSPQSGRKTEIPGESQNFLNLSKRFMSNRKSSGGNSLFRSHTGRKTFGLDSDFHTQENGSISCEYNGQANSFKKIASHRQVKKIYLQTQSYLKDWVNNEGWKSKSIRSNSQNQKDHKQADQFIQKEKTRIKQRYYKIGAVNTKYQVIVKTLFGQNGFSEQGKIPTARQRLKTSRV